VPYLLLNPAVIGRHTYKYKMLNKSLNSNTDNYYHVCHKLWQSLLAHHVLSH